MSALSPPLDYTDKDFDSLRRRLILLAQSAFPEWSDFDTASFGTVLLELYAFIGDVLTFYLDNLARESRLQTATQRQNVLALTRMLGYRMHGPRAATATLLLTLDSPARAEVRVPAHTTVRTQEITEPVRFQLLHDARIPAGHTSTTVLAEHSESHTQRFDARGQPSLEVPLRRAPFLDGSARVTTPAGPYLLVESFLGSGPHDRHVTLRVDASERATLRFGDGRGGLPPTGTITIHYKTGGGLAGDLDAGRLVVLDGAARDARGRPVQLTVTNPRPAVGGAARESLASARIRAPEGLRAMTRSVAREDFEINARRLPDVARALMLTSNEDPSIPENAGVLYIVPRGGGRPTPALMARVHDQVTRVYPCTLTFQVRVQPPVYKVIDVHARVFLTPGATPAQAGAQLRAALEAHFRVSLPDGTPNPRVQFGFNARALGRSAGEVAWSDVFNVARDAPFVRKLGDAEGDFTLNGASSDVALRPWEFPVLGGVTLLDGSTGRPL